MDISMNKLVIITVVIALLLAGCSTAKVRGNNDGYEQAMKEAYAKLYQSEGCKADALIVDYFGEYEGCHVGYIGGFFTHTTALEYEKIGSLTFCFPSSDRPWVYCDGKLMQLSAAYEAGWLSDEAIGQIYKDYFEK